MVVAGVRQTPTMVGRMPLGLPVVAEVYGRNSGCSESKIRARVAFDDALGGALEVKRSRVIRRVHLDGFAALWLSAITNLPRRVHCRSRIATST